MKAKLLIQLMKIIQKKKNIETNKTDLEEANEKKAEKKNTKPNTNKKR